MLDFTRAIVIHSFPYSDSSIIAKTYCEKGGYTSFLAKGYKKGRKHKAALHPLAAVEISFNNRGRSGLIMANKIDLYDPYSSLLFNPVKSGIAMFLAEWLSLTLREDKEGDPRFFSWLSKAIETLNELDNVANFHLWFLIKLSDFLGISPQGRQSVKNKYFHLKDGVFINSENAECLTSTESAMLDKILNGRLEDCLNLTLKKAERALLLSIIRQYYQLHLDSAMDLKTLEILPQLFEE